MMPQSLAPFEQVIFEYKPQPGGMSKGELFLEMIDADHELLVIDVYNQLFRESGMKDKLIFDRLLEPFGINDMTPLYLVLDRIFSQMLRQDFHLTRNFTVVESIKDNSAKWPKAFGSALFLDSTNLFENSIDMIKQNVDAFISRNHYSEMV